MFVVKEYTKAGGRLYSSEKDAEAYIQLSGAFNDSGSQTHSCRRTTFTIIEDVGVFTADRIIPILTDIYFLNYKSLAYRQLRQYGELQDVFLLSYDIKIDSPHLDISTSVQDLLHKHLALTPELTILKYIDPILNKALV